MAQFLIVPIRLPTPGIEQLCEEARRQGYNFLDTLITDWESGANRFDAPGETLLGHFDEGIIVALGGLNQDPFLADPKVGRVRRVYVREGWRNRGIGVELVHTLLQAARKSFRTVRLRSDNSRTALFYERIGFQATSTKDATHVLNFDAGLY